MAKKKQTAKKQTAKKQAAKKQAAKKQAAKKQTAPMSASPSGFLCTGCGAELKGVKTLTHPEGSCPSSGKKFKRPIFELIEV